jgi:hypothetical protein
MENDQWKIALFLAYPRNIVNFNFTNEPKMNNEIWKMTNGKWRSSWPTRATSGILISLTSQK